jgi:dihydropteroate synthase
MPRTIYLRPIGLAAVPDRSRIDEVRGCLPLAGNKHLDFTGVEVIERLANQGTLASKESEAGTVSLKTTSIGELNETEWGRHAASVSHFFNALVMPRPAIAGLPMNRTNVMGIVNVTPDSFSDDGRHRSTQAAIDHGLRLAEAGASILDIGGESTRPGSDTVPLDEELRRVMPVIEALRAATSARLSIDTRKAEVMRRAAQAGVDLINDVSALSHDPASLEAAAATKLPVVLMHALGDPKTMQADPRYANVLLDVFDYLEQRIAAAEAAGISRSRLVVDPGIGFGKTVGHNLQLLAGMALFHSLGVPVLVGASRKRFIGSLTGVDRAEDRTAGSLAAALSAVSHGAQFIRVHDVAATVQALAVWRGIEAGGEPTSTSNLAAGSPDAL